MAEDLMAIGNFVAYYRVSTQKQGRSGLGLEAQRQAVHDYLNGGKWRLVAEVVEVESGKRSDRPKLQEALALCRLHGARLLVAKLDRLARNVAFISTLMERKVAFVACDMPDVNELTIHVLAAVAQHEAKAISERTKAALAAAKQRHRIRAPNAKRIGNDGRYLKNRDVGTARSVAVRKAKADQRAADLRPVIESLRASGIASLRKIADALNERSIPAARGGTWSAAQVLRIMLRGNNATA
jgi:DNA invertase Pin-like site-specific DNA recombinase